MVTGITQEGGRLTCTFERKGKTESVSADGVLICVGRRAVTEGLNLEAAGVETERGRVKVGEGYKTNVPHIYAIGDVYRRHSAGARSRSAGHCLCGRHLRACADG